MSKINVLLLCGGGSSEHDISLISANYIQKCLKSAEYIEVHKVEILKNGDRRYNDEKQCELRKSGKLIVENQAEIHLNFAIPCIHGFPGETGDIQSLFEMMDLPYLGAGPESSKICFNKVSTKLWLNALEIPNTPFIFINSNQPQDLEEKKIRDFYEKWDGCFVKASSQGSSVGCYLVNENSKHKLKEVIDEAKSLSPWVLLEKPIKGREIEVSVYEYDKTLQISNPGEICCPEGFYTYEEKYDSDSKTTTNIKANLEPAIVNELKSLSKKAFRGLNLKHLSRIDFFLTENDEIYLNEINTFPGLTPISMFPKMMEANGHQFNEFLINIITKEAR